MKLNKAKENPILTANTENEWESLCVLNPAVVHDGGKFHMLYRAAGQDERHYIYLGYATSADGIHFQRESAEPVLRPDGNGAEGGCVEDPRLVRFGEWYYLTYASRAYPPGQYWREDCGDYRDAPEHGPAFLKQNNSVTNLAITRDFLSFKKLGRITDSRVDDRDVVLFPEQVNGKYVKLSRPMEYVGKEYGCKMPSIWIDFSEDLMEWRAPRLLMTGEQWWESKKLGASCPPISTQYGWFHLYHGVAERDGAYRVGAVILDAADPTKILARTKDFLMEPEYDFETGGFYNGCVFPTGNVVVDGTLYVYYGAGDRCVCAATVDFESLLHYLMTECKR